VGDAKILPLAGHAGAKLTLIRGGIAFPGARYTGGEFATDPAAYRYEVNWGMISAILGCLAFWTSLAVYLTR
jgi:hypothetical protein